jgi:hypothetical protein
MSTKIRVKNGGRTAKEGADIYVVRDKRVRRVLEPGLKGVPGQRLDIRVNDGQALVLVKRNVELAGVGGLAGYPGGRRCDSAWVTSTNSNISAIRLQSQRMQTYDLAWARPAEAATIRNDDNMAADVKTNERGV